MTLSPAVLRVAADRLLTAEATPQQCDPVRDILGDSDIAAAYAVQNLITADSLSRGRTIVGHKIGLTSPAVQRQLGVDQPDSGVLFADMRVADGAIVPSGRLLQPKVEAEIAFIHASGTGPSASSTPSLTTVRRRCSFSVSRPSRQPASTSSRGQ